MAWLPMIDDGVLQGRGLECSFGPYSPQTPIFVLFVMVVAGVGLGNGEWKDLG